MNEHFYMKMHLADTPQRGNAKHFGAGIARDRLIFNYQTGTALGQFPFSVEKSILDNM